MVYLYQLNTNQICRDSHERNTQQDYFAARIIVHRIGLQLFQWQPEHPRGLCPHIWNSYCRIRQCNIVKALADGYTLLITTSCDMARTGEIFCDDPIEPDVLTQTPLEDAVAWIATTSKNSDQKVTKFGE